MQISQAMPQELLYNLLYTALSLTDSILQIWLTLTFAVIVSTYVAGKRFDKPVYLLVSGLYAFASAIQLLRFCSAAYQAFYYKDMLVANGLKPWAVPTVVGVAIALGSVVLIFAGTLGTLWFVRVTWKSVKASSAPPEV